MVALCFIVYCQGSIFYGIAGLGIQDPKYLIPILRSGTEHITAILLFNLCTPSKMRKALENAGFVEICVYPHLELTIILALPQCSFLLPYLRIYAKNIN